VSATGRDSHIDWAASAAEKGGYDYFMLKEIAEQPRAVAETLLGRVNETGEVALDEMRLSDDELRETDKIIIIAAGTSYYAGMVAKYAIEHWTRIPCEVELASEFRYRDPIVTQRTLVVIISQSGETMDTLMALRHAREQGRWREHHRTCAQMLESLHDGPPWKSAGRRADHWIEAGVPERALALLLELNHRYRQTGHLEARREVLLRLEALLDDRWTEIEEESIL
jgi:hypothetical protein